MRLDKAPVTVLLLLAALAAVQMLHYYPQLPEQVAVHFGSNGEPNGWSGKGEFALLMCGMEALFVVFALVLTVVLDRIPAALVNIPNRNYWLAPERRVQSMEFIKNQVVWMEVATLGFFVALAQLVILANLGDSPPRLTSDFWYVFAAFVGVMLWLALRLVFRFVSAKDEVPPQEPHA
jgi:serine/threonine-protein kinase